MFESLKIKIAHFIIRYKYLRKNVDAITYTNIIKNSKNILLITPEPEEDFYYSTDVLKYFSGSKDKKNITLFISEPRYNSIGEKEKYKFVSYHPQQMNRFFLPAKNLEYRLKNLEYGVVIDLNRKENVFASAAANIVKSQLRVGFVKESSDKYYNLHISDKSSSPETAYKNLLNYIQMF